jgi:hypothetical protein
MNLPNIGSLISDAQNAASSASGAVNDATSGDVSGAINTALSIPGVGSPAAPAASPLGSIDSVIAEVNAAAQKVVDSVNAAAAAKVAAAKPVTYLAMGATAGAPNADNALPEQQGTFLQTPVATTTPASTLSQSWTTIGLVVAGVALLSLGVYAVASK